MKALFKDCLPMLCSVCLASSTGCGSRKGLQKSLVPISPPLRAGISNPCFVTRSFAELRAVIGMQAAEEARAWAVDERDAVSAQLLAVTGERDAALRRCRELTAALEVSSADGARARYAHMLTHPSSSLLLTVLQEPKAPYITSLCCTAMHECAQWYPRGVANVFC